jgi:hypothetical protein
MLMAALHLNVPRFWQTPEGEHCKGKMQTIGFVDRAGGAMVILGASSVKCRSVETSGARAAKSAGLRIGAGMWSRRDQGL